MRAEIRRASGAVALDADRKATRAVILESGLKLGMVLYPCQKFPKLVGVGVHIVRHDETPGRNPRQHQLEISDVFVLRGIDKHEVEIVPQTGKSFDGIPQDQRDSGIQPRTPEILLRQPCPAPVDFERRKLASRLPQGQPHPNPGVAVRRADLQGISNLMLQDQVMKVAPFIRHHVHHPALVATHAGKVSQHFVSGGVLSLNQ